MLLFVDIDRFHDVSIFFASTCPSAILFLRSLAGRLDFAAVVAVSSVLLSADEFALIISAGMEEAFPRWFKLDCSALII